MKIAIVGSLDYPDLNIVQNYISRLQLLYRPWGCNFDDEYEEPITILSLVESNLDMVAVVKAGTSNFKVEYKETLFELIYDADFVVIFRSKDCKEIRNIVDKCLELNKNFELYNTKGNRDA